MQALTLHRDEYGPPAEVVRVAAVPTPRLGPMDADRVLVSVLATGPNFNTNFAALGLPVPVFGRGDAATVHVPGSDAVGIVVDAGPAVDQVRVGDAVILDSWTGHNIRGYETHDGFNAQFATVDQDRAIPVPPALQQHSPERLAALLLTYGTAYRAVVERLRVKPGDSLLVMGGGKGTSFAGAQLGRMLGARVILVGSNPELGAGLVERGIAHAFVNRRDIPSDCFGVLQDDADEAEWLARTQPFRDAVLRANDGRPVDKVFEHTGGRNFPLLVSTLAEGGALAFFGATGGGLKGEYKQTFFHAGRRFVMDARWVWMRQKQVVFRRVEPARILDEIGLLPGRRGLIWGADEYSRDFAAAALARGAQLVVIASHRHEAEGIAALADLGVLPGNVIDRDRFELADDMPDPLTPEGTPDPTYASEFMTGARALGRAVWEILGPRVSPDFVVERTDQSTLHYSTFLVRDHDELDAMSCGYVVARGPGDLTISGSHMYHGSQARETVRLLAGNQLVMEQDDLEVVTLEDLPALQQKMLDGTMTRPKGVALVQVDDERRRVADLAGGYVGRHLRGADPAAGRFVDVRLVEEVAIVTLTRPDALNALSEELLGQLAELVDELTENRTIEGEGVSGLVLRGAGRAFVAGADIELFIGRSADELRRLADENMAVFTKLENLPMPVVALVDGFALGGGNELAISAHHRIVTENAVLGQPEVKLGIIPGYGGMQRLPRLIGPRRAAELAVNGEPVDGAEAVRIGLAHELQPSATALRRAFAVVRESIAGDRALDRADWDARADAQRAELQALLSTPTVMALLEAERPDEADAVDLVAARRYAARTALEALATGYELGVTAGLANDARLFGEVTACPSGQHWSGRFLAKDPAQSTFLTLLPAEVR